MVNRENMEKWINALETYDREPARYLLIDEHGRMCAIGIGVDTMDKLSRSTGMSISVLAFPQWLGLRQPGFDVNLKSDHTKWNTVVEANDQGLQSPWTIAQRLRETYLKEGS